MILMLTTHNFISVENPPPSFLPNHLSTFCIKLKHIGHLTYSRSTVIKQSSWLWPSGPYFERLLHHLTIPRILQLGFWSRLHTLIPGSNLSLKQCFFFALNEHLLISVIAHWLHSRAPHPCLCYHTAGLLQWGPVWDPQQSPGQAPVCPQLSCQASNTLSGNISPPPS